MDDQTNPTPTTPNPAQPPAASTPQNQTKPADSTPGPDAVKMAEELGRLKKVEEDYKKYVDQIDPVIQTLWSDQELLKKTTEVHNKRLGISPTEESLETPTAPPIESKEAKDTRNWAIKKVVSDFYTKYGIDKLTSEQKEDVDQRVGIVLKETLNPTGGKTLAQIMEDVPLDKLPDFLDKAYVWATKDDLINKAKEQGKMEAQQESTGVIGSMPSASISSEEVTLTAKQREVAKGMGVSDEAYLKNVKEIAARGNQLY